MTATIKYTPKKSIKYENIQKSLLYKVKWEADFHAHHTEGEKQQRVRYNRRLFPLNACECSWAGFIALLGGFHTAHAGCGPNLSAIVTYLILLNPCGYLTSYTYHICSEYNTSVLILVLLCTVRLLTSSVSHNIPLLYMYSRN